MALFQESALLSGAPGGVGELLQALRVRKVETRGKPDTCFRRSQQPMQDFLLVFLGRSLEPMGLEVKNRKITRA